MKLADDALKRSNTVLRKAIKKLEAEKYELQRSFDDTGWERFRNGVEAREKDIQMLDDALYAREYLSANDRKLDKYRSIINEYPKKLSKLKEEYPGDDYVDQIVGRCKSIFIELQMQKGVL